MKTLVVDASVAMKWLVLEEMSDVAKELSGAPARLVASRLILTEVANALARRTIFGTLTKQEAVHHFKSLRQYLPELIAVDDLIGPALENACKLRHPIYDLIYLETARRPRCATDHRRPPLHSQARQHRPRPTCDAPLRLAT